jgi:hypothetical protein
MHALQRLRFLWAAPCSLIGAVFAILALAFGGSCRRVGCTVEVALRVRQSQVPTLPARWPFGAITFGHVILGQSHEFLASVRAHELIHVRQYEAFGPFFLLAYPAASAWALLHGHCPYAGNYFEQQAVKHSSHATGAA